jgi:hypothetical protein
MLPFTQGDKFPVLAINIGNPWTALMLLHFNERLGTLLGIAITVAVTIVISVWGSRAVFQTPTNTLMLASFSLLVLPYVMPRMHDRYFFAAEVFLCILSCIDLDFWFPAALVLSASLISYSNYFLYHVRYLVLLPALLATRPRCGSRYALSGCVWGSIRNLLWKILSLIFLRDYGLFVHFIGKCGCSSTFSQ